MQEDSDDEGAEAKKTFLNVYDETKNKQEEGGQEDTTLKEIRVTAQ
jgi:hypothetical protein